MSIDSYRWDRIGRHAHLSGHTEESAMAALDGSDGNSPKLRCRSYYFRWALIKTFIAAITYLAMPLAAKWYHTYMQGEFLGYTILGAAILIIVNLILTIQSWFLFFDRDFRIKWQRTNC